ncbi:carnitine 3-dehydrogenase [Rhodobium orientis]|uniref:L-carnitine dehydrogenase n=1 Tax=Rhodobium orientis TaxID=34017 RepID=A0A327JMQ2_9HYPH|nr:carnitine 3-dehydrogenase [Rhodobium orientis]MBB4304630.1 carnitine 3-dehydrogenase [Rhodobium orientis]MBK5950005.1 carnitine 3-dehydrogenase [Rhodobium orientis]RAI27699.1 carnitine 3-dehydrogenase [Rhodobium orientis]
MHRIKKAACIGGGVIGGGWAARFLLSGHDVAVYDPHPECKRLVETVLANAARAYGRLTMAPLPKPGTLTFAASLQEAVADTQWVQESVPERLDLKQRVLAEIDAAAPEGAIIGSSTSGLLPSDLQRDMRRPERFFVAHPFNPVYLVPLVELVGGKKTSPEAIARAEKLLAEIGMKGVAIEHEIEAFVADRLMEALWREALWLVNDGVATVTEIDDIMRYGFGLRWAQMGLFQTYRIAGGEAGMRHFLHQFGPALKWPWTKLMDVPDLTEDLINRIADQSDAQAGVLTIRDLERIRDDNLVAILQALKAGNDGAGWGAGALLKDFEARLQAEAPAPEVDLSGPLRLVETTVGPAWIDYNGHMTEHRYLQLFGDTTDALLRLIGVDADYVAKGASYYTVETHIRHLGEAKLGERLHTTCQVVSADDKRLHVFHTIRNTESAQIVATAEQMLLHVDTEAGKSTPAPRTVLDRLEPIVRAHAALEEPDGFGRKVGEGRE